MVDILTAALSILIPAILFLVWRHYQTMQRLNFYKEQGVYIVEGAHRFFFGNMPEVEAHRAAAKTSELPIASPFLWLLDQMAVKNGDERFEAHKHPVVCYNIVGTATLVVQDPEMVRDLLTKKDPLTDKTGLVSLLFNDLIGESFLFSRGDANWKAKR